ncbi:MAG: hypothetical protein NC111_00890 [Bacteroides sp.]|nr:hypothetical protein [Bacteroides sp.]MCM1413520.1 hypothetical protein [Bacteroides sp.]MCM1471074.1 hypothetical protein [Bacteroides sp.]
MISLISISPAMVSSLQWAAALLVLDFLAVIFASLCDLASGLRKVRRSGLAATSRGYRRTIDKLLRYFLTMLALMGVDSIIVVLCISLRSTIGWNLPALPFLTTVGAFCITLIEAKSVMENTRASAEISRGLLDSASELSELLADDRIRRLIELLRKIRND